MFRSLFAVFAFAGICTGVVSAQAHSSHSSHHHSSHSSHCHGHWQGLNNPGVFGLCTEHPACGSQLLLTDGSVMVFNFSTPNEGEVWRLTPDVYGSYVNGTWSKLASLPEHYRPFAFASAVLADGRVIVQGGAFDGPHYCIKNTDRGAIYDPVENRWHCLPPPPFFHDIVGNAQCVILEDGTYMVANALTRQAALLDLNTLTWIETGACTKWDVNSFEGWTLLPNGKVLTVDTTGVHAPDTIISTNVRDVGHFHAKPANGPFVTNRAPRCHIEGHAALAKPDHDACCNHLHDLRNSIGVCYRSEKCGSDEIVENMFRADALAVIEISDKPVPYVSKGGDGRPFSCMISKEDGESLVHAMKHHKHLKLTIKQPDAEVRVNYAELYDPKTGTWHCAGHGNTIVPLWDPESKEMGPAVLRPDGTVFCTGAFPGYTAIYCSKGNKWSRGPRFPYVPGEGQLNCAETGAALLPNGNVLVAAYPHPHPHVHIFEFDGHELHPEPTVPHAKKMFGGYMLVLPTGQIMMTDALTTDVQIYTSGNTNYDPDWAPEICEHPEKVRSGKSYKIEGIRFNGMSQGAMYGANYQSATNYPLVRITNEKAGYVYYCRTHNHSYMGVASCKKVHTYFHVPCNIPPGRYTLEVVANGIPSKPKYIHVK